MLALLLLATAARADDLSCYQVTQMAKGGMPLTALVETITYTGISPSELDCLRAAGLPQAVVQAAVDHPTAAPPPVVEAPQARAVPSAPPVTLDALYGVGEPCSLARLQVTMPNAGTAVALSGFIGFGAGHFYAHRNGPALLFAATQLGGVGMASAGWFGDRPNPSMAWTGALVFGLSRLLDVAAAPASARTEAFAELDACGL